MERVIIYQEKQSEEDNAEIIVKIFVEFTNGTGITTFLSDIVIRANVIFLLLQVRKKHATR